MTLNKLLYTLIAIIVLSSCGGSKITKTLRQGNVVQKDFKVSIPFEYRKGLIILKVTIQDKTYDFLLDSGATNVISTELASELKTVKLGVKEITDIHNKSEQLSYVKLNDIQLGGINFRETITTVIDIKNRELSCLNIDGFIGANLMRFAVWDFDFENQLITITNDESKLNIPSDAEVNTSKLFIDTGSVASIITKVNGDRVLNNKIDLGNNSNVLLTYITFSEQKKSNKISNYKKGSGITSIGAFGKGESKDQYFAEISEIQIGNHIIKDKIVRVRDGSSNLGIAFFKNYRLILNWKTKKLKMIQKGTALNTDLYGFGFNPNLEENKLYVGFLYNETKASNVLQLGDQIQQINNVDYTYINNEKKCEYFNNGYFNGTEEIVITVIRNGKKLNFQLKKEELL